MRENLLLKSELPWGPEIRGHPQVNETVWPASLLNGRRPKEAVVERGMDEC